MSRTETMIAAAIAAGEIICRIYARGAVAGYKPDRSPVTDADVEAEAAILAALAPLGLPVLAEESAAAGHIPVLGERFFIVDPLDGTREFLKRNGEFTVNIALWEHDRLTAGVILAPDSGELFWSDAQGAFSARVERSAIAKQRPLRVTPGGRSRIVASRSHGHAALNALMEEMGVSEDVSVGSSLKFCLVARGEADFYPRFGPTCEWDTAAGQAILEAAGGAVLTLEDKPLRYGRTADRHLNPFFVAASSHALALEAAAAMRAALAGHDEPATRR